MGRKQWEKEKLLITSNFSFSYGVFKRLVMQTRKNRGLFGKGLTDYLFIIVLQKYRLVWIERIYTQLFNCLPDDKF